MTDETKLTDDLTEEELTKLLGMTSSGADGKNNVHTFLTKVVEANDTTKLGYLLNEELGKAQHPVRAYKFLGLFADKVMKKEPLNKFFLARSEILTSTSLSRDALLMKLAVTQKRELADVTKQQKKENKGWFKKKDDSPETEQT